MTDAHRLAALLLLLAMLGVAASRLVPDRVVPIAEWPCPHPIGVALSQRTVVTCLASPTASIGEVLRAAGAPCPDDGGRTPARPGELLRVVERTSGRCAVTVERLPATVRLTLGLPVDLNQATAEELIALPRIGPVLAKRIVEHRQRRGAFASVEELRRVRGIGPATLARLRPLLTVESWSGAARAGRRAELPRPTN